MKLIYTKHARERIARRRLSYLSVEETVARAERKVGQGEHVKFIKLQGTRLYQVVAKYLPRERAWLVVSAWVRGEEDRVSLVWRVGGWGLRLMGRLFRGVGGWLFGKK